jgi:hypothetical protein
MTDKMHIVRPFGHPTLTVAAPAKHLSYGNGPLLTSVEVYTIFWGSAWQQGASSELVPQVNEFFNTILTGALLDLLAEYSVPGKAIGHGKRIGSATITASEPGGGSGEVTDSEIQQALTGWLANGTIPPANDNTLYFVYLPPNVIAQGPGLSCQDFCGYHGTIPGSNPPVYYAVMPYPCESGCMGPLTQAIQSLTSVSSHELCEAITDPVPGTGWYDGNSNGEIGDLCNWQIGTADGYTVQKEWSNKANACVQPSVPTGTWHVDDLTATANAMLPGDSSLSAYAFEAQGTQHVIYRGGDNHLHELWWDGAWHVGDLTAQTNAPPPQNGLPVSAYAFETQGTQHVMYVGTDSHLHELWWDGGWHVGDLTAQTNAPAPALFAASAYAFENQGTQHVIYVGADTHLHELWWDGGWHVGDLTTQTNAPPWAAPANPTTNNLSAYAFEAQGTQHVMYLGTDNHINELRWDGGWQVGDLTAEANAPAAQALAAGAYAFEAQGSQHVMYVGTDNDIHELYWDGAWHDNDLTTRAGAPPPATPLLAAYAFEAEGTQHVMYVGTDNHIHELYWDGAWKVRDLTTQTNATSPETAWLSAYAFEATGTQHVMHVGTDNHIHELWWG